MAIIFGVNTQNPIGSVNNLWREPIALCQFDWGAVAEKTNNSYEIVDFFPAICQAELYLIIHQGEGGVEDAVKKMSERQTKAGNLEVF